MSAPAGYPVSAPPLRGPAILDQLWADVTFLHWPVEPDAVRHFFPPGTRPDVFDGMTYVGLVPFAMRGAGFGRVGAVPYFGSFLETNVRLYSIDDVGHHGVLFRTLDTSRLAIVPFARTMFGVPYVWSQMRYGRAGSRIEYCAVRRWPRRGLSSRAVLEVGERVTATALEVWLTARWGLHSRLFGRTWWTPNEHGEWPLFDARLVSLADDFVRGAGVATSGEPLRPLFSPGVHTRFGLPSPL